MNKVVLGFWSFAIFFSVLTAACSDQKDVWSTVVMPLMCLGVIGFKRE